MDKKTTFGLVLALILLAGVMGYSIARGVYILIPIDILIVVADLIVIYKRL